MSPYTHYSTRPILSRSSYTPILGPGIVEAITTTVAIARIVVLVPVLGAIIAIGTGTDSNYNSCNKTSVVEVRF